MKKTIIKLFLVWVLLFAGLPLHAQEVIVIPNQTTVYWDEDPVDVTLNGTLTYQIYVVPNGTDTATVNLDDPDYETAPNATSQLITFPAEGLYIVGVRTKRLLPDGVTKVYDNVNWSNVNGPDTPKPFAYLYAVNPNGCTNLRPNP